LKFLKEEPDSPKFHKIIYAQGGAENCVRENFQKCFWNYLKYILRMWFSKL